MLVAVDVAAHDHDDQQSEKEFNLFSLEHSLLFLINILLVAVC